MIRPLHAQNNHKVHHATSKTSNCLPFVSRDFFTTTTESFAIFFEAAEEEGGVLAASGIGDSVRQGTIPFVN